MSETRRSALDNDVRQWLALAEDVARDEPGAVHAFRQALEPWLRLVVRRALRTTIRATPWTGAIRAEAQRVQAESADPAMDAEALAAVVAQRCCTRAINRLQQGPDQTAALLETVLI